MTQQEWLDWRRQGVGASDAPIIMGVSPWRKVQDLWEEKVFGKSQEDNIHMKRGRDLEPLALDWFMCQTGYFLSGQERMVHPKHDWMRATLDGYCKEEGVLLEIKSCTTLHNEVPKHYYPQLQHKMEVVGVDEMYYVSFDGVGGKILKVKKDPEYVKQLIEKEYKFWEMVLSKTPPEDEKIDMSSDEIWKGLSEKYKEVMKVLADLEEKMRPVEEEKAFLKSQFILFSDCKAAKGHGVTLSKIRHGGRIDYKSIPELKNVDLERYKKCPYNLFHLTISPIEKNIDS